MCKRNARKINQKLMRLFPASIGWEWIERGEEDWGSWDEVGSGTSLNTSFG